MYKIAVCTPGSWFSTDFLSSYTRLLDHLNARYDKVYKLFAQSTYLHHVRNGILGGKVECDKDFKPWGGEVDYTHILWIDSDMVFEPWMVDKLLANDVDIVGGDYPRADLTRLTAAYTHKDGVSRDVKAYQSDELVPVDYIGFGLMLIKRGVHEALTYPWYDLMYLPTEQSPMGQVLSGEDVSFCHRAKEAGYTVYADPVVTRSLGHQKQKVLKAHMIEV